MARVSLYNIFILFFLLKIISIFLVIGFAGQYMILGDSDLYLGRKEYEFDEVNRTYTAILFYKYLSFIPSAEYFFVPLITLFFCYKLYLKRQAKPGFLVYVILLIAPGAIIWLNIPGKESLFVCMFMLYLSLNASENKFLKFLPLLIAFSLRPTFLIGLILIFLSFSNKRTFKNYHLLFILFVITGLGYYYISLYEFSFENFLIALRASFSDADGYYDDSYSLGALDSNFILMLFENAFLNLKFINFLNLKNIFLFIDSLFALFILFYSLIVSVKNRYIKLLGLLIIFSTQLLYGGWNDGAASRFRSNWVLPLVIILSVQQQRKNYLKI